MRLSAHWLVVFRSRNEVESLGFASFESYLWQTIEIIWWIGISVLLLNGRLSYWRFSLDQSSCLRMVSSNKFVHLASSNNIREIGRKVNLTFSLPGRFVSIYRRFLQHWRKNPLKSIFQFRKECIWTSFTSNSSESWTSFFEIHVSEICSAWLEVS